MQKLAAKFVACADEVFYLHNRQGAECDFFRGFCEEGHYGGRSKPTNTRQGIYCATPSGKFLASINTTHPRHMERMLREAWKKWEAMPADQRLGKPPAKNKARPLRCPTDGLVLRSYVRDMPRANKVDGWRGFAWNTDTVWFRKEEARALLPEKLEVGAQREVSIRRLTRFVFVDSVRGQTRAFRDNEVRDSWMKSAVMTVEGHLVRVAMAGGSHAEAGDRGVKVSLIGSATYDTRQERFVQFEVGATGTRWGATRYNARSDDQRASPIGYALVLAAKGDTVEPAFWWAYSR
ncbi:MAG: hypothetical protein ACYTHK_03710 [Planctomycetota bacterium]